MKKILLIVFLVFIITIGVFLFKSSDNSQDEAQMKERAISYAIERYGENIKFIKMTPKRAIKMFEGEEVRWILFLSQEEGKNKILYIKNDSEGSSLKIISDKQFDKLYKIKRTIVESESKASEEDSISALIFDLRGQNPDEHQYTYEPLGDVYEYYFEYDGPDYQGIGSFPMDYSVYVDNKGNVFFSQITGLLFAD